MIDINIDLKELNKYAGPPYSFGIGQLAEHFGIDSTTFRRYLNKHYNEINKGRRFEPKDSVSNGLEGQLKLFVGI